MKKTNTKAAAKAEVSDLIETYLIRPGLNPDCVNRFNKKKKLTPSEEKIIRERIYNCSQRLKLLDSINALLNRQSPPTYSLIHECALELTKHFPGLRVQKKYDRFVEWVKENRSLSHRIISKKNRGTKYTPEHVEMIRQEYCDPFRTKSIRAISRRLNPIWKSHGLPILSRSTINSIVIDNRTLWEKEKLGKNYLKNNETPAHRIKPEHAMTMVMMDGSPWNIPFEGFTRFQLFPIRDVSTGKIVSYSIDESENSNMVFDAIKMMCNLTGYLPKEIVSDNSSAYNTPEFKSFMKSASERYGVIFTRQRVGNSKGNSQIEFGQRLLQMIGMDYPEFLGMGVRTKSKYSRKSDDVINEQIKPKNQPSREYVIESIIKVVTEFNNTSFDGELTPNQKFDTSDKPYAIKLEPYQIADLFWKSRRVTISKGRIKITNRKQDYYFLLNNADRIKYDGSEVVVRYDERDMSEGIYAFTTNELPAFLFKADIQPGFRMAKVEQTEEDSEAISKIWKHNREWRKMIDAKVENSSKEALEQIQLKGELANWRNTPKQELKKTEEDAAMARYVRELHNVEDSKVISSKQPQSINEIIKTSKKVKYTMKVVE